MPNGNGDYTVEIPELDIRSWLLSMFVGACLSGFICTALAFVTVLKMTMS